MIKLEDILLEAKTPSIFIPRRVEDRLERYIKSYIKNGSKGDLNLEGFGFTKIGHTPEYRPRYKSTLENSASSGTRAGFKTS